MSIKRFESLTATNFLMKKLCLGSMLCILFFVTSCSSDNDDDMDGLPATAVSYEATIKLIIDNNCLSCHVDPPLNGASMPLISLENVREAVMNRDLIGRVSSGSMPPVGDFLTAAQIQALKDWKSGGFQD